MNKVVPVISSVVIAMALLFNLECMNSTRSAMKDFLANLGIWQSSTPQNLRVFTREELSHYRGENGDKIYLAIVGNVFDVTSGKKHYGPGGGYEFFAGIDASRSFVTGQFDQEGLVDDISGLSTSQILSLENWKSFFESDYIHIGIVEGSFYNKDGKELPSLREYWSKLKAAKQEQELLESDKQLFPPCNSEWSQRNGGRVWCSTMSGGIKRDWEGVPRMYYMAGSSKPRCACVKTTGPPSTDLSQKDHNNRGDLDNPNLKMYPNCGVTSNSCALPQK